jgi:choline dehydrogenase-like flavoprotein
LDFDAAVIGSGAGGGTAAAELARGGLRVLLVERGGRLDDTESGQDERRMLVERAACDDRAIELNGHDVRVIAGGVTGGSTSLFGAALLRPSRADFEPGRFYAAHLDRSLWAWPVPYDEMEPYFDRAEDLYGVAGDHEEVAPHLGRRRRPYLQPAEPLEPISERLAVASRRLGLHPFRLPLAIDFARCRRCATCPGYACPTGARASSFSRAIEPAARTHSLTVWERCEVERIETAAGRARGLWVRFRDSGRREFVRAGVHLVGAGAIGTPALLLASAIANESDQLGRNHMCHLGAAAAAVYVRPTGAAERFSKQIGLSDFYLGTPDFAHKMGYAQAVPVPGPLTLREHAPIALSPRIASALHRRSLLFVGSIEDLPQATNRVTLRRDGRIRLDRRFHPYDVQRARHLARALRRVLRRAGAAWTFAQVAADAHEHVAHQVGTCRFGRDPLRSVLDPQCRVHGYENLYVVDGSFLPTSLGVGPALTIAANALRVAAHILKERP